jgi:hypothetical protein
MKLQGIAIKGWRIDRGGKLIKSIKHLDVSARLRQRGSKKVRIARKGQA